jgi:hypothetical protein
VARLAHYCLAGLAELAGGLDGVDPVGFDVAAAVAAAVAALGPGGRLLVVEAHKGRRGLALLQDERVDDATALPQLVLQPGRTFALFVAGPLPLRAGALQLLDPCGQAGDHAESLGLERGERAVAVGTMVGRCSGR